MVAHVGLAKSCMITVRLFFQPCDRMLPSIKDEVLDQRAQQAAQALDTFLHLHHAKPDFREQTIGCLAFPIHITQKLSRSGGVP